MLCLHCWLQEVLWWSRFQLPGLWQNLVVATPVVPLGRELLAAHRQTILHAFLPKDPRAAVSLSCLECRSALGALSVWIATGATVEDVENFAINECINLNLYPEDVCFGMVKLAGPEVLYVFSNTNYSHDTMCGWMFGLDCVHTELDSWTVEIPGGKPEPNHPEPVQPTPSVKKILHLSDLHVDLLYDEGSAAVCDHPYCCRNAFGTAGPDVPAAGHWGTLAYCDIPLHTLEDLLSRAAEITKPDLVYITGDLPPHDVWAQNHATNLIAIEVTMELVRKHFPGVPVLNTLGNHASAPVNSFVVPAAYGDGWSMSWLYDSVADLWAEWLPESALVDVRRGGFYQYSPVPGLRVISLNMNFCNSINWWLLIRNEDPVEQLKWFVETLAHAEAAGEAVHIIGHIPTGGGDCEHTWSHVFNQIVYRYESTIRGIFFGHTHGDSWSIYYDMDTYTRPVAVSFISPSGTTGTYHHPAFKVFEVDGGHEDATWVILDATAYSTNLTEANVEGGFPVYTVRYNAQDSYDVKSLTPTSMHELVLNMVTEEGLYDQHYWNVHNDLVEVEGPSYNFTCGTSCLKFELCEFVISDSSDRTACHKLEDYIDANYVPSSEEFYF
ncbi:sphingomyelin phosphodiesterase-like isoform X2 [Portunus trituberculatus]|uniref:sphingomyelin phosphodiesterase-like isoform X2 n=1 Tax=Portunus trituberculatus TaxID=210409 RepID=UPI001E1CD697|nr:sphingomyelin phosphodiesterase-like isoform X2 [Portunus trituberculatus]